MIVTSKDTIRENLMVKINESKNEIDSMKSYLDKIGANDDVNVLKASVVKIESSLQDMQRCLEILKDVEKLNTDSVYENNKPNDTYPPRKTPHRKSKIDNSQRDKEIYDDYVDGKSITELVGKYGLASSRISSIVVEQMPIEDKMPKNAQELPKDELGMLTCYLNGDLLHTIAYKYGTVPSRVYEILMKLNFFENTPAANRNLNIIKLFESGYSREEISNMYGISIYGIRKIIAHGCSSRHYVPTKYLEEVAVCDYLR